MLAWIRSPRGSTTTATVVVVLLALFWFEPWGKPLSVRFPFMSPSRDAPSTGTLAPDGTTAVPGATTALPGATASAPIQSGAAGGSSAPIAGLATSPAPVEPAPAGGRAATAPSAPAATSAGTTPQAGTVSRAPGVAAITPDAGAVAPSGSSNGTTVHPSATASAAPVDPSIPVFDVVRVEPTGAAVIAGRAPAGSGVTLMDGDKVIGHVTSDAGGQFVVLPETLSGGSHYLTLQVRTPDGKVVVRSVQGVAVSIAGDPTSKPLVALMAPDAPTRILSDGAALAGARGATSDVSTAVPVAIQSVEAGDGGRFTATGVAHPGNQCRVYLNGAFLADVTANRDGHWSVEIKKGMQPGKYTVRADEMDASSSKVLHRAEVPFDYPTAAVAQAAGGGKRLLMTRANPEANDASRLVDGTASGPVPAPTAGSMAAGRLMQESGAPHLTRGTVEEATKSSTGRASGHQTAQIATAASSPASEAVIADLQSATVIRGDSLWRISRKMLGHGIRYTAIYASNAAQIRDPALIYPGQIFVVPNKAQP